MDRPSKGPINPDDRDPVGPDARLSASANDPWAEALRALRAMEQGQPPDAPSSASPPPPRPPQPPNQAGPAMTRPSAPPRPRPGPPRPAMPPAPPPRPAAPRAAAPPPPPAIDETLDALQALARRYRAPPAETIEDDPFPRRPPQGRAQPPTTRAAMPARTADEALHTHESGDASPLPGPRRRFGSIALVVGSAAVLAVLILGAISLWRQMSHVSAVRPEAALPGPAGTPAASGLPGTVAAVRMPGADGALDLPTIERAMSACDDEAAKNRDALYFLILPLASPVKDYQRWISVSVGEIGTSVVLLRSKDALDGLRDGSLTLHRGAYSFSIIDASTDIQYDWTTATGVSKLTKMDAAPIAGFRVRFGFADFVGDTPSNFRFPREKGVCYWVSALLRS